MPLSRDFKEVMQARVQHDTAYRKALLQQAIQCLLEGEVDAAKSVIRVYINATIGFETLGELTGKSPKSLMRMFSSQGNPSVNNLFEALVHLQNETDVQLEVHAA